MRRKNRVFFSAYPEAPSSDFNFAFDDAAAGRGERHVDVARDRLGHFHRPADVLLLAALEIADLLAGPAAGELDPGRQG